MIVYGMSLKNRSHCPITFGLDLFGDKWSLLILRDMMLMKKCYYDDFLKSGEGISTNILANRLQMLEKNGLINKVRDPENKKRFLYNPTEKGLDLLPIMLAMVQWSAKYDPETDAPENIVKEMADNPSLFIKHIRASLTSIFNE